MKEKNKIRSFLKKNGFEHIETNSYVNGGCNVVIEENNIAVADNNGVTEYISICLYSVIGILTAKNYLSTPQPEQTEVKEDIYHAEFWAGVFNERSDNWEIAKIIVDALELES